MLLRRLVAPRTAGAFAATMFAAQQQQRLYATRYFTESHEWVDFDAATKTATVGITDHAQDALGDVVYVGLPSVGDKFEKGATFGEIESVKATNDIYSPCNGTVSAVNDKVKSDPSLVNKSPEEEGWMIKYSDASIVEGPGLMGKEAYTKFLDEAAH